MSRMKIIASILAAVLSSLISFSAHAEDWPHWRGPDFNGISKETGWSAKWPAEGPKRLWKAAVGIGFASLSVSQGRAYTVGNKEDTDTVFCFDANSGAVLWKYS